MRVINPNSNSTTDHDPFFLQFHAINRSAHLHHPLLSSSSPPLTAIFSDFFVASSITPIPDDLGIPNYIVSTTSVKFFCLTTYLLLSDVAQLIGGCINTDEFVKVPAILTNSFDGFEPEALVAANNGILLNYLPPVIPIGPLEPYEVKEEHNVHYCFSWLDSKPAESVVYVNFGSRTTMSKHSCLKRTVKQRNGGEGLGKSAGDSGTLCHWRVCKSLWMELCYGSSRARNTDARVAATRGSNGERRGRGEKAGLGMWERKWGWGVQMLVDGEDIAGKIRELMENMKLRRNARMVGEEARKTNGVYVSSAIEFLNHKTK
ncbi:hypothetical protein FEM48_Zijuj04G0049300 [Ziziphus jujuba var. spinosa]|uniref:Uncharacterized protein n=1 Tax=Ziziphus jujuba var. spinosa TaxID=714518 RepID=A0A978VHX4_ZIZJJ|nr:hypothetical protein FEM48_Zijuj04G0049300 [Ziziphus jujuba var. spinosa]